MGNFPLITKSKVDSNTNNFAHKLVTIFINYNRSLFAYFSFICFIVLLIIHHTYQNSLPWVFEYITCFFFYAFALTMYLEMHRHTLCTPDGKEWLDENGYYVDYEAINCHVTELPTKYFTNNRLFFEVCSLLNFVFVLLATYTGVVLIHYYYYKLWNCTPVTTFFCLLAVFAVNLVMIKLALRRHFRGKELPYYAVNRRTLFLLCVFDSVVFIVFLIYCVLL